MGLEKLYTVDEVMEILRISRGTLYRLIKDKELHPIKVGNRTLFPESELTRFIESLKQKESE